MHIREILVVYVESNMFIEDPFTSHQVVYGNRVRGIKEMSNLDHKYVHTMDNVTLVSVLYLLNPPRLFMY